MKVPKLLMAANKYTFALCLLTQKNCSETVFMALLKPIAGKKALTDIFKRRLCYIKWDEMHACRTQPPYLPPNLNISNDQIWYFYLLIKKRKEKILMWSVIYDLPRFLDKMCNIEIIFQSLAYDVFFTTLMDGFIYTVAVLQPMRRRQICLHIIGITPLLCVFEVIQYLSIYPNYVLNPSSFDWKRLRRLLKLKTQRIVIYDLLDTLQLAPLYSFLQFITVLNKMV
ncbi:hypothetical protein EGR_03709 [Echinococcus granulosus]|uniref:Uncharacterized protein n=1 Tax=Echinococcus granulosus TaxID=6210 RepID=W6V572_ECHGR|nr:hypothetical protein EGR_03709 [Echinococcus granulosus]EUB61419.1 hypothetical protein EGR_03709 [Echinococcus granulosus]